MAYFKGLTSKNAVISDYKPFYIQKTSGNTSSCFDTKAQFGMVAKASPYPMMPKPKEPYKNNWLDMDGEDEYTEHLYYEPIEIEVSFYAKALATTGVSAAENLRSWLNSFFLFVKEGELEIYDSYTAIGRRGVRYADYTEESFVARDNWASTIFKIKYKVNDPTTLMKMSGGVIVEA